MRLERILAKKPFCSRTAYHVHEYHFIYLLKGDKRIMRDRPNGAVSNLQFYGRTTGYVLTRTRDASPQPNGTLLFGNISLQQLFCCNDIHIRFKCLSFKATLSL